MNPVSGKRMARALEAAGWELDRVAGSHHTFKHPDGRRVTVPVHGNRDLRKGTQHDIMKHAGLTDDDL